MKISLRKGFSFGLTSGIITTLGLIVGLHYSTKSRLAVLGGIFVIAIADALSDSMGMHLSEESENKHRKKFIWESMVSTFLAKFVFALSFVVPIILLPLNAAIVASIFWGLFLISIFSYHLAKQEKADPYRVVLAHFFLTCFVIIITYFVGSWVSTLG